MKIVPVLLTLLFCVSTTLAQLSPGDLHKSHQKLEGIENCVQCHESGQKLNLNKCLKCHTFIQTELDSGKGLHAQPKYKQCENCHVEHQGRNVELIYWPKGMEKFDHTQTGYTLLGKHKELKCRDCHKSDFNQQKGKLRDMDKDPDHSFLGLNKNCQSCHRDEHRQQFSKDCLNCHEMSGWKPASKFDHNSARYRLTGRHIKTDCVKCHTKMTDKPQKDDPDYLKFKPLKFANCFSCHQDPHQSRLGKQCSSCHQTSGWNKLLSSHFDHNKTRYPLKGKHQTVSCASCHKPGQALKINKFDQCKDCHDSYHRGQFSNKSERLPCSDCHSVYGFSPSSYTLQEHQQSQFPIEGAHLAIPCIACHKKDQRFKKTLFKFTDQRCVSCHKNPHQKDVDRFLSTKGSSKKDGCLNCHQPESWRLVTFDHSQTKFELQGRHLSVQCIKCHEPLKSGAVVFKTDKKDCAQCHQDQHNRQFLKKGQTFSDCAQCHTPKDWLAEKFIHNRDSRYALNGSHLLVPCSKCHQTVKEQNKEFVRYKPLDTACKSCHTGNIRPQSKKQ